MELIDTQWDVNLNDGLQLHYWTMRINRYIVGCKYFTERS